VVLIALGLGIAVNVVPLAVGLTITGVITAFIIFGFVSRQRRFNEFEKKFARALQRSPDEAAKVYSRAWLVRLFSPREALLPKIGLVELERGHFRRAEDYFEQAWLAMNRDHRNRLIGPLVRTKASLGEWGDVLVLSQDWVDRSMTPVNARVYLAAAILQTNDSPEAAERAASHLDGDSGGLSTHAERLYIEVREELQNRKSPS
jgi:tetratricopeptide (TPR) repeat protein